MQMIARVFTALLFLLLLSFLFFCASCGRVHAEDAALPLTATAQKNVQLFKTEEIKDALNSTGKNTVNPFNVADYYSPFILSADGVVIALAGVNRTDNAVGKNITVLTKYIETKEDTWVDKAFADNDNIDDNWKTQLAVQKEIKSADGTNFVARGLLAASTNEKIYILLVNCSSKNGGSTGPNWEFDLAVGTFDSEEKSTGKQITWQLKNTITVSDDEKFKSQLKEKPKSTYDIDGSAFFAHNGNIMFLLKVKGTSDNNKNITALLLLEETETNLKFLHVNEDDEVCHFNVFPWGAKIIAVSTDCNNNNNNENNMKKIKESVNMGEKWDECKSGVFCRWEFMKDMKDSTAMNITGRPVLLFTQHMEKNLADSENKKDIYLWLSDGNRMHKVGLIVGNVNITSVSMLYTKGELFSLHQPWDNDGFKNITLTHLEKTLENITFTLDAWNKSDKKLITLYQKDTASNVVFITSGLVGFLSESSKDDNKNEWKDEYLYTNAIINGGDVQNVVGGFTFKGKNAGAKWPVGKKAENQPYNFTDPGFTLVADVKIENNNGDKKDNSLLGVIIDKNSNKGVGLWCTKDNKLGVTGGETEKDMSSTTVECNQGEMYQVALVLNASKVLVYVDWEKLKDITNEMKIEKKDNITHLYFGADESQKEVESYATVTNVLLYNRPFTEDEIKALRVTNEAKENEGEGKSSKTLKKEEGSTNTEGDEGTAGGGSADDGGKDTAAKDESKNNTEKEEKISPSQPEVSVMRVDLLHLLFAVCTAVFLHN